MNTKALNTKFTDFKKFAVIGNPIAHSRSPELHQAFAKAANICLSYHRILAPLDGFDASVQDFFAHGGHGLNVTVPFKQQAFELCDVLTTRATAARAVNTLWQQDGKLYGDNTDGQGLVDALHDLKWNLKNASVLILGAGGATRGVILPLIDAGVTRLSIANRTTLRAVDLVNDMQDFVGEAELKVIGLEQLQGNFDIIINATSASLSGEELLLPETLIFSHAYEMAYGKPSSFLDQATQRGIPTSDGFSMLVGQAIEAFSIWNSVKPELKDFISLK